MMNQYKRDVVIPQTMKKHTYKLLLVLVQSCKYAYSIYQTIISKKGFEVTKPADQVSSRGKTNNIHSVYI